MASIELPVRLTGMGGISRLQEVDHLITYTSAGCSSAALISLTHSYKTSERTLCAEVM